SPSGFSLYTTDGTEAGTVPLGPLAAPEAGEFEIAAAGGSVYFLGFDPEHGRQLWVSDGTSAGSRRLSDLEPPATSSHPQELTAVGPSLLFSAFDGAERSFWRSDGTEAGTAPIAPSPFPATGRRAGFTPVGAAAFFFADPEG